MFYLFPPNLFFKKVNLESGIVLKLYESPDYHPNGISINHEKTGFVTNDAKLPIFLELTWDGQVINVVRVSLPTLLIWIFIRFLTTNTSTFCSIVFLLPSPPKKNFQILVLLNFILSVSKTGFVTNDAKLPIFLELTWDGQVINVVRVSLLTFPIDRNIY